MFRTADYASFFTPQLRWRHVCMAQTASIKRLGAALVLCRHVTFVNHKLLHDAFPGVSFNPSCSFSAVKLKGG
jgi:hypothetical protein